MNESQIQHLIENYGKEYTPALLPIDLNRGKLGTCFDTCMIQALSSRKYRYVEGVAKSFNSDEWKLHAWLTDGEYAFDPTWRATDNTSGEEIAFPGQYIGIEMDTLKVAAFMANTEYQGVLANRWRNTELADACLPEGVKI